MSATNIMHIIVTSVIGLLTLLNIRFGPGADGKWFRLYSIGTILAVIVFGTLAWLRDPRVAAVLPTPWMGAMERVNVYSSMLWVLVLAVVLLRAKKGDGPE